MVAAGIVAVEIINSLWQRIGTTELIDETFIADYSLSAPGLALVEVSLLADVVDITIDIGLNG